MIKIQVIGNLGKDATVNQVNGKSVINLSVCHTEKYKDNNGVENQKSVWCDCSWWTDRTNVAQYLKKGTQVHVDGQPDVRVYQANGKTGASLTIRVGSLQLLGSPQNHNNNNQSQPQSQGNYVSSASATDITEPMDDLPF
jgi:single-strand DNA-binding protein